MSKALNQIEPGTSCKIKKTGEEGILQRVFYYPTKYLIKMENGEFDYYTTHEVAFEGYERPSTTLKIPEIPYNSIGSSYASWIPFNAESHVEHHFLTSKEIIWEMITSLETYNIWFHGIQRALPDIESERYVHQFSFDKLPLKPGSYFKIRPASLAPWFRCRIITVEKEKEFGFYFRMSPLFSEYISFKIEESQDGVFLSCSRSSKGIFSFLSIINWNSSKSKILQRLAEITPVLDFEIKDNDKNTLENSSLEENNQITRDQTIALVVNKALDGDQNPLNAVSDKITRGKAKAMLIKIKRGTAERPPAPDLSVSPGSENSDSNKNSASETDKQLIEKLVPEGLKGNMEKINSLDNKVLRGKIKAAIVKAKRVSKNG